MLFLYFPVWKFGFVNFSRGLFREYLFHTTQFISWLPFVRKIQTECEFSEPTEQQQFVCGRVVPAKDVRIRVRALVTIEIGAKNKVHDPVYPLPCLPSWSKPLSYRKLPIKTVEYGLHFISRVYTTNFNIYIPASLSY